MSGPPRRLSRSPAEVYPLIDYHSVMEAANGEAGPRPAEGDDGHRGAPGDVVVPPDPLTADEPVVVVDPAAEVVQDHYLNAEDLVAAGLLGPEHDPARDLIGPGPPPQRRHRLRSTILAVLATVIVVIVVGLFYVRHQISPGGPLGPQVAVVIPAHSSSAKIGSILAGEGIIRDGGLFPYYVKVKGAGPLLAGTYHLAKNESYGTAVSALVAGPPKIFHRLTIPEGYTLGDIAQRLAALPGMHLSAAKFLAASTDGTVRSPYEPPGVNDLEGLVFPATYNISSADTEVDVMQELVGAFDQQAAVVGLAQGAAKLHVSPYDVVKVASIVEGEAKLTGDRGPVASSIYNRLTAGMTLGADSTLVYALRKADPTIKVSSINYNQANPFNTRLNKGLPPTPIDNPGVPSLQAASNPPATPYLYFVETNPDGKLSFAATNAGFQMLLNQCAAAKLC